MQRETLRLDDNTLRLKAYELWLQRGQQVGTAERDWFDARQLVLAALSEASSPAVDGARAADAEVPGVAVAAPAPAVQRGSEPPRNALLHVAPPAVAAPVAAASSEAPRVAAAAKPRAVKPAKRSAGKRAK